VPSLERKLTATERFLNGPERGDETGLATAAKCRKKLILNNYKFQYMNIINLLLKILFIGSLKNQKILEFAKVSIKDNIRALIKILSGCSFSVKLSSCSFF
jgi:hypothetical protein